MDYCHQVNWKVEKYSINWKISYSLGEAQWNFYPKKEGEIYALHDYELFAIAIYRLEQMIYKIESCAEEFTIVDGNEAYHKMGIDWQITPKTACTLKTRKEVQVA
jgi:hypothetical protein